MEALLRETRFDFISPQDKDFILAFTQAIKELGYDFGDQISSGYCWGKYMIIYTKGKQCVARLYLREHSIVLRLYLNKIDDHRAFIESGPSFIKTVFTSMAADCKHCHNEKEGRCQFRKSYTMDGRSYEKCNGLTFEFEDPDLLKLPGYIDLIREFALSKRQQSVMAVSSKITDRKGG